MVAEARSRIYVNKQGKAYIFLPKKLTEDSAFPFKPRDEVIVKIQGNRLIIEPA